MTALKSFSAAKELSNGGLLLAADVARYQCFREGPAGNTAKKDVNKIAFEAGMCMKTNKSQTKCLGKSRTFMSKIRTFASNRHEFCRKRRLVMAIRRLNSVLGCTLCANSF
jgi:hypothetical protein